MDGKQTGLQPENRTPEEKRIELYLRQKELLDTFLASGAINRAQYDKSFGDLTVKMGMQDYADIEAVKEGLQS